MNSDITKQLIELNRKFYDQFGDSFSATRQRLQPGVKKILETIQADDSVLDLGCGNGHFLHELHDVVTKPRFSAWTLACLCSEKQNLRWGLSFGKLDLMQLSAVSDQLSVEGRVGCHYDVCDHASHSIARAAFGYFANGEKIAETRWKILSF
jgi:hypothetical protein